MILGAGASRAATPHGDKNGHVLPLMADLIDIVELKPILESVGISVSEPNLEAIYQELTATPDHEDTVVQIESLIREYFKRIEIPENANFYDYLLLSLRDKDLVATFNWDPLLLQAYRRNAVVKRLPKILFLHGKVAIGICLDCQVVGPIGMTCENGGHELEPTRLLYPIQDKDYVSDPFVEGEWDALKRYLAQAYIVTIVGYSAPDADAAAVDIMRGVWDDNQARELAQIEIVNTQPKDQLFRAWEPFIVEGIITLRNQSIKLSRLGFQGEVAMPSPRPRSWSRHGL